MTSPNNGTRLKFVALPNQLTKHHIGSISFTDHDGTGMPCRRCLQDTKAGEMVQLISYDHFPIDVESPYRGAGPIFLHKHACTPFSGDAIPDTQLGRAMSLRGFTKDGMMQGTDITQGEDFIEAAKSILGDRGVMYIDVHNAKQGCFALRVERNEV